MGDVEMSHSIFGGLMHKLQEKDDLISKLEKELREARERIYDLTKCWACDEGRDDEACTCTDERKGIISKLKDELREARERIQELENQNKMCEDTVTHLLDPEIEESDDQISGTDTEKRKLEDH